MDISEFDPEEFLDQWEQKQEELRDTMPVVDPPDGVEEEEVEDTDGVAGDDELDDEEEFEDDDDDEDDEPEIIQEPATN